MRGNKGVVYIILTSCVGSPCESGFSNNGERGRKNKRPDKRDGTHWLSKYVRFILFTFVRQRSPKVKALQLSSLSPSLGCLCLPLDIR